MQIDTVPQGSQTCTLDGIHQSHHIGNRHARSSSSTIITGTVASRGMKALIFDMDGTLADSVYSHVLAWLLAFVEAGIPIDGWRLHGRLLRECQTPEWLFAQSQAGSAICPNALGTPTGV